MGNIKIALLLCAVFASAANAETLARWNQYWEDNPEAWQDKHQYERWEHGYFADEHRWQSEADRNAWYQEYQDIAANALAEYERALADITTDDSYLNLQDVAPPEHRSKTLTVYPLYSAQNLAGLHDADKEMLDQLVTALADKQNINISVRGHTNNVRLSQSAAAKYGDNKGLSLQRAQAVADYLKTKIGTAEFDVDGFGDSQSIDSNETSAGRSRNRRVEITLGYDAAPDYAMRKEVAIPADFAPWWQSSVMNPMTDSKNAIREDIDGLYFRALSHSSQIKVFQDVPLIR